jgi:hypothetical protein
MVCHRHAQPCFLRQGLPASLLCFFVLSLGRRPKKEGDISMIRDEEQVFPTLICRHTEEGYESVFEAFQGHFTTTIIIKEKAMRNSFKTSSTYRAARKQQKTANRKTFYDEMNYMISPSEWADGVISGFIDPKTSWSNDHVKGKLERVTPRSHWTKKGYKEYLDKSRYVSQQEPEAEIVEMMDLELVF